MSRPQKVYIWQDGSQKGPFTDTIFIASVRTGNIPPDTPSWTTTDKTWRSASELVKTLTVGDDPTVRRSSPSPAPNPTTSRQKFSGKFSEKPKKGGFNIQARIVAGILVLTAILSFAVAIRMGHRHSAVEETEDVSVKRGRPAHDTGHLESGLAARPASNVKEAEDCVLMARSTNGSGTAFIAEHGGRHFVYTNVHVASSGPLRFIDFRGNPYRVSSEGEVVGYSENQDVEPGVDLVRFRLLETPKRWLSFATRDTLEDRPPVWALGDSAGERILKTLEGKITGIGPSKIEVSCEIVPGNSGGPIVTSGGKVVGIASYLRQDPTIWAKGTEHEVRRVAWIPGQSYKWISSSSEELSNEAMLVEHCSETTGILWVVSTFNTSKQGFLLPDDFPDEVRQFMRMTEGHPLSKGMKQLGNTLENYASDRSGFEAQVNREFVRYYRSCASYQKSHLEKACREIRSSFWKARLDERMGFHRETLDAFSACTRQYERSGELGQSLADF